MQPLYFPDEIDAISKRNTTYEYACKLFLQCPSSGVSMGYNGAGTEFGVIIFKRADTNWGVILRAGYSVEGIEEIRFIGGEAQTSDWVKTVSISDLESIHCSVDTVANTTVTINSAPNTRDFYIPAIVGHSVTNDVLENVFFDYNTWKVFSNISQRITVRFYKYPM